MSYSRAKQNRDRGYSGLTKLRKTLRRIDPETTAGVKESIQRGAEAIETDILINGQAHRITGDMLGSVAIKYGRDKLTAVIGPGASSISVNKSPFSTTLYVTNTSKFNAWQFFKAYWIEFGTKGAPSRNIPPQPAKPFVQPAWDSNKTWLISDVKAAVKKAIQRASSE